MADDLGWSDIAAYRVIQGLEAAGSTPIPTPNIDRLATNGMLFTNAHSAASVCAPSRFAMMTGSNPHRNGRQWGTWGFTESVALEANRHHATVGEVAQGAGYRTAFMGKMHLGGGSNNYGSPMPAFPNTYGFDYCFNVNGGIQSAPFIYFENGRYLLIDPANQSRMGSTYGSTAVTVNATTQMGPNGNGSGSGTGDPNWNSSQNGIINSTQAVAFIDDHLTNHGTQPFLLYYCPPQPHAPHTPPIDFEPDASGTPGSPPNVPVRDAFSPAGPTAEMVHELDLQVGKIIAKLEDPDGDGEDSDSILADTLILFTSDHGGLTQTENWGIPGYNSNGPLKGYKGQILEGGHRVPFIAMWGDGDPAGTEATIVPGSIRNQPICNIDWVAMIYALTETHMPADQAMDSANILPVLLGEADDSTPVRNFMLHQSQWAGPNNPNGGFGSDDYFAIRQTFPDGEFVLFIDDDAGMTATHLYNVTADLGQTTNLIGNSAYTSRIADMKALFLQHNDPGDPRSTEAFILPESDPPTPNPAGFATGPVATGPTSVTITSIVGSDLSGPVEYLFIETSGNLGGSSSGWQLSPDFIDSGLLPNTTYGYTVTMRDSQGNTGVPSSRVDVTTPGAMEGGGGAADLISSTSNNGNFEDPSGPATYWTGSPSDADGTPTASTVAGDGTNNSGRVGQSGSSIFGLAIDTSQNGTGYTIDIGDRYDLAFDIGPGTGWDADVDQVTWALFYTSDDTIGGSITNLDTGNITNIGADRTGTYPNVVWTYGTATLPTTAPVTDAGAVSRKLWLAVDSAAGAGKFVRLDEVNLTRAASGPLDTDGDGIPDDVENTIPGLDKDVPGDALLNLDKDRFNNLAEHIMGTGIADPSDFFEVSAAAIGAGLFEVTIPGTHVREGRLYILEYSLDLGFTTAWIAQDSFAPGPGDAGSPHIFSAPIGMIGYFRIRVEWAP